MRVQIFGLNIAIFLTGCVVGFGAPSESGPPRIESWVKPNTSAEQRMQDSKDCGGTQLGSGFNDEQLDAERQPNDSYFAPLTRLHHKWERCMLNKDYKYTGQCLDNPVSNARPACGAP